MDKRTFLLLTDLHYADPNSNYTDDAKGLGQSFGGTFRTSSFPKLNAILEHGFAPGDLDFIAVAGDITTRGKESGFEAFDREIASTLRSLVPPDAVCMVPGNHDVKWDLQPSDPSYFQDKFARFLRSVDAAKATTCVFPRGGITKDGPLPINRPKRGPLYIDEVKKILVLNINSAFRCGELWEDMHRDFTNWYGAEVDINTPLGSQANAKTLAEYFRRDIVQFTQEQQDELQDQVSQEKDRLADTWDSYLKVAVVHHHLVHFPDQITEHKGYEFMLDSSLLLEFLTGFDFDIILTGHKHQAYEMVYHYREKQIFIVGGSTVGGRESGGSFRGVRQIEFESDRLSKQIWIKDINEGLSKSDVRRSIQNIPSVPLTITISSAERRKRSAVRSGFSYREVIATTNVNPNGDARRSVQCEGLLLTDPHLDPFTIRVTLPKTSGYIDLENFKATSSAGDVDSANLTEETFLPRTGTYELTFRPPVVVNHELDFAYDWTAINSYALDRGEFKRMYANNNSSLENMEYASFQLKQPAEKLTVVVRLPDGFEMVRPPSIRVAKPNPAIDSRQWVLDASATHRLESEHSLLVIPALSTLQLTVMSPELGRSYGIEWELPNGRPRKGAENIAEIVRKIERKSITPVILYRVLSGIRATLLSGWDGQFDMNLMIFDLKDHKGELRSVAAGRFTQLVNGVEPKTIEELSTETYMRFGFGVAGRTYRSNRPQFHISPELTNRNDATNTSTYYIKFPGSLDHKKLVCFPVHKPVSARDFDNTPNIYASHEPYGVLNIGSEDEMCPLSEKLLSDDAMEPKLKSMQHQINKELWQQLFGAEEDEEKRSLIRKNVSKTRR